MAQATKFTLGPWVRLEGISIASLPPGATGIEPTNSSPLTEKSSDGSSSALPAPSLQSFITNVLTEAIPFIDGVSPKNGSTTTWKSKGSPKRFASSEAPVHLYEYVVSGKDLDQVEGLNKFSADRKDETWFCRRSCHRNEAVKGTATWEEFTHSFKDHHAETEDAFTPTVIGARKAMTWDTGNMVIELHEERWHKITMVVEEMKHKIDPKPLKNRTFPVVQVAATLEDSNEFLVISIPLNDFEKSPYAEYARNKSLVVAAYTSIERIRILPSNGDIEWIMATASDAKGVLPQWMQNMAVPGAVAKDVEMFMSWIPTRRTNGTTSQPSSPLDKALPEAPTTTTTQSQPKNDGKPQLTREKSAMKDLPAMPASSSK